MEAGITVTYIEVTNGQVHYQYQVDIGDLQAGGDFYLPLDTCTYESCKAAIIADAITQWQNTHSLTIGSGTMFHLFGLSHDTYTTP